jgi:hypothetical protein
MRRIIVIIVLLGGVTAAYIAGTKAGRSRYRRITSALDAVWSDPEVRKLRKRVEKRVRKAVRKVA